MTDALIEIIERKYIKGQHKTVRPVDASSLVLMDGRGATPKVLMGKRNPAAKFMPGFFVFPGGRVEKSDADVLHAGHLRDVDVARLNQFVTRPSARRIRALALAAIRETFEETGLRLGVASERAKDANVSGDWAEFLSNGQIPTLEGLIYAARAITPPGRPRRFDTRFFVRDVSDLPALTTIRPTPDSELVELVWVDVETACTLESAEITQIILGEIRALAEKRFDETLKRPFFRARHKRFERIGL